MTAVLPAVSTRAASDPLNLEFFHSERVRGKIVAALAAVSHALARTRRPYVAFSGGKDSLVTLALVHRVNPDVPLIWSDDELEYPETVRYMAAMQELAGEQLRVTLGWAEHAGWFRSWQDRPYWREPLPGAIRAGRDSDEWAAREGYDLVCMGLRMDESQIRRGSLGARGPVYTVARGVRTRCCPLWDWSADDVWAVIAGWGLPYNPAYDILTDIGIARDKQRVGPLPLTPRRYLADGWPDLLERLEARYRRRWV